VVAGFFFMIFVPSWWKITDVTKDTCLPERPRLDRPQCAHKSAIFHHEGTKITKKQKICGATADIVACQMGTVHPQQLTPRNPKAECPSGNN